MATRRDVYESGRADERSEVVAWLRALSAGDVPLLADDALVDLARRVEAGEHAENVVAGAEAGG